ncbi:hypothetical protein [Arthrobacter sp. 2MCAF14]|uniref:hypothetical protein n=1 Tax=Arthrobacter sp. 2MCAF14 TaxID=3232982 RepID=UPI003F9257BF
MLFAYAVPSVLLIFPDTAMGFAVSHIRAFPDDTVPHSRLAMFLIQSGMLALIVALILFGITYISNRKRRLSAG